MGGIDKEDVISLELIPPTDFEPQNPNTWKVYKSRHKRDTGDNGSGLTTNLLEDWRERKKRSLFSTE